MFVIIGYVIILGCVLGGFLMAGGHLGVLMQPVEVLIIVGAATGAFLASNTMHTVKASVAGGMGTLKGSRYTQEYYLDLLMSFNALCQNQLGAVSFASCRLVSNMWASGILTGQTSVQAPHRLDATAR